MTLFLSLLPLYLLGNLHCLGMCGPLVMLLAKHKFRNYYFLGRLASFSLAGLISAEIGILFNFYLDKVYLPFLFSLAIGTLIFYFGCVTFFQMTFPFSTWFSKKTARLSLFFSTFLTKDDPIYTFLFGFFTILLPCGQSLIVFTALALSKNMVLGLINGFLFALLTSPSLIVAMHSVRLFSASKLRHHYIQGVITMIIGLLAIFRGCADLQLIPHCVISSDYHIVLF